MKLYSTNNSYHITDLRTAVMHSLAPDNGLYMPTEIPLLPKGFVGGIQQRSMQDIGYEICKNLFKSALSNASIANIIEECMDIQTPVHRLKENIYSLELWHGPTAAFKDFGARFLAAIMAYFNSNETKPLTILVATSGDTGGAVASAFLNVPGIEIIILYPKEKVSLLQEKQLTTLGNNIHALEIEGTFDDCQDLVKQAFQDKELNVKYRFSSANSINIARLIPQTFYYFDAYRQVVDQNKKIAFSVPCGNLGNLTAGLIAMRMGLPVSKFIAATNINNALPQYLETAIFTTHKSIATISNAMDVGKPSNFPRLLALYKNDFKELSHDIHGNYSTDTQTLDEIRYVFQESGYITDPHGAIAHRALRNYLEGDISTLGIFLETAHPAKFSEIVNEAIGQEVEIPDNLKNLESKQKNAILMSAHYPEFKEYLMSRD